MAPMLGTIGFGPGGYRCLCCNPYQNGKWNCKGERKTPSKARRKERDAHKRRMRRKEKRELLYL